MTASISSCKYRRRDLRALAAILLATYSFAGCRTQLDESVVSCRSVDGRWNLVLATRDKGWPAGRAVPMSVWGANAKVIFVAARGGIYRSKDGGGRWTLSPIADPEVGGRYPPNVYQPYLWSVWGSGPDDVYAVGFTTMIVHTRDGGETWQQAPRDTNIDLYSVWCSGRDDVYAVGGGSEIFRTLDGGATWQLDSVRLSDRSSVGGFAQVWGTGPEDVYLAEHELLHSSDRGQTWQKLGIESGYVLGTGPDDVYLLTNHKLYHSGNRWRTWTAEEAPFGETAAAWAEPRGDLFVAGPQGGVLRRSCIDGSWQTEGIGRNPAPRALWGDGEGRIFAACSDGVYRRDPTE